MFCPSCAAPATEGQRFCSTCGASLTLVAAQPPLVQQQTVQHAAVPPPTTLTSAPFLPPPLTDATTALTVVEQTQWDPGAAGAWPTANTDQTQALAVGTPFAITPLLVMADITGLLVIVAAFVKLFTIQSDTFAFLNESKTVSEVFSNFTVAAVIGAIVVIGGAVLGATGRRFGTGLAGGAGLSIAGIAMLGIAFVIGQFEGAEFAALSAGDSGTVTFTREPGFWILAVAALAGLVVFALSLREAGADGRAKLASGAGLLGAAGAIAVMVGPLVPVDGASFGDNFTLANAPPALLYLRLGSLVLIAICGVVGFLNRRVWGIGLALGGISIALWQWFTTQASQGTTPVGIGAFNPGADDRTPHIVTTLGLAAMVVAAVVALVMAAQSRTAETPS